MSLKMKQAASTKHITVSLYPSQINSIRQSAKKFGSVGRAILVATEVLLEMASHGFVVKDPRKIEGELKAPMSFDVLPRTVNVIESLTTIYGDRNNALRAIYFWLERS